MTRFLVLLSLLIPSAVFGAGYPDKPIKILVPFAPGGASDFVARIIQPTLQELLGQPIVIENKPGAAGNIAVDATAKAAPDGYTLLLGNIGAVAINPSVFPNLTVDPQKDLVAITEIVDVPSVLIAHPALPANNVRELIAYAKAHPGKLNYASPGSGSQNRLEMEQLRKHDDLDMVHVPYKGGAGPAVAGLMAGETDVMFVTSSSALTAIKAGRVKVLAVTTEKRLEAVPNAPTMIEQGYPELRTSSWQGMFAPAGTPKEIVERLYGVFTKTMAKPDVAKRLATGGVDVVTSASPAAFSEFIASETTRWAKVVKESHATVD